ncbi:tail fiber assembly protein [Pseudomonas paraeruginosa]
MIIFFHAATGGFYSKDVHGDRMPVDGRMHPLEETEYLALLAAQGEGKQIVADDAGRPLCIDPPAPAEEVLAQRERIWRDRQLALTDGPIARHRDELDLGKATTLDQERLRELTLYRASLRDWPASAAFPALRARPEPPQWLEPLITP